MRASASSDSSAASSSASTFRRTSSRLFCVPGSTRGKPPGVGVLFAAVPFLGEESAPDMHDILRIPFSGGRLENTMLPSASTYLHTDPCATASAATPRNRQHTSARTHRFPAWEPFFRIATECTYREREAKGAGLRPAPRTPYNVRDRYT